MADLPSVTVIAVTGVDPEGHREAIRRTREALPFPVTWNLKVVPGMTLDQYSIFMVKELHAMVKTDFALTVQSDGYGVNKDLWDDVFFSYDYLGSPWPWPPHCANGGLSLRSKRLLELCAQLPGEVDLPEDYFICVKHRQFLEDQGIKFAPLSICSKFSFELPVPELPFHAPEKSWGRHGNHT